MRKLLDDNHLTHLSPREKLQRSGCDWRSDAKSCRATRFAGYLALSLMPAMIGCWFRAVFQPPLPISAATIVFALSALFAVPLVAALLTGRLDTNTGLYFRKSEPLRYWLHILCLVAFLFLPALAIACKAFGFGE
ncbi:MAG: hypothetical protein ACAI34_18635 [Verrucomicrobium sp.]|nr:hypothetical protein [Verrucomicrobium sp.]